MTNNQKRNLYSQLIQDEALIKAGIVVNRKTKTGQIFPFISGDKLAEFTQISGYTLITPLEQLREVQKLASQAQTPAQKNKYLTKAKKLFEKLHPEVKKQNICPECLKKINSGRK